MTPTLVISTAEPIGVRLFSSTDHQTPATGKTVTLTASKACGAFAAPVGTVAERGSGYYNLAALAADLSTLGPFILHAEASGCDPADWLGWVVRREGAAPLTAGTAANIPFLMEDTVSGTVQGAVGLTDAVATILWSDGTSTTGAGVAIGFGWYYVAATPPVSGIAEVSATGTGAKCGGGLFEVGAGASTSPTSLLNAIKNYWADNGLAITIAPLFAEAAPAKTELPFIIIDNIAEVMPGETPDDKPVEMFISVWAATSAIARAKGQALEDEFGDVSDATRAIDRDPFTWTTGSENFCERDVAAPSISPRPYTAGRPACYRIHYRFWIRGRP